MNAYKFEYYEKNNKKFTNNIGLPITGIAEIGGCCLCGGYYVKIKGCIDNIISCDTCPFYQRNISIKSSIEEFPLSGKKVGDDCSHGS